MDEVLKAISARVHLATALINQGRTQSGRDVLKGLISVLPEPEDRNIEAAICGMKEKQANER